MAIARFFSNLLAITRKELKGYFASPLAYIVAAVYWFVSGIFFVFILLDPQQGIIPQIAVSEQLGYPTPPIDVVGIFLEAFFSILGSLSLFILPILSMGLYAEERKRGTLELLATSPLTNWVVALGKLLAVVIFFTVMILPLFVYEIIIFSAASPPVTPAIPILVHLALILLATAVLSLGMFISSLTDSVIIAAVLTFATVLLLWLVDSLASGIGGTIGEVLAHISLLKNYSTLVQGVLDLNSLVVFASYIFLGLFLTAQSVEILKGQQ